MVNPALIWLLFLQYFDWIVELFRQYGIFCFLILLLMIFRQKNYQLARRCFNYKIYEYKIWQEEGGSDTDCACCSFSINCIMFVLFVWRMESINYVLTLVIFMLLVMVSVICEPLLKFNGILQPFYFLHFIV